MITRGGATQSKCHQLIFVCLACIHGSREGQPDAVTNTFADTSADTVANPFANTVADTVTDTVAVTFANPSADALVAALSLIAVAHGTSMYGLVHTQARVGH